jgi:ribosome-associated protein
LIIQGIQEKKGKDIVCLDLKNIENAVCSYFIVCHGDSNTQVNAIADSIYDVVKKASGEFPWHKEGFQNAEWILLDYSNVVVHIFQKEIRDYYNLEKLWADAKIRKIA